MLLIISILGNFAIGRVIIVQKLSANHSRKADLAKIWLILGLLLNLTVIGYFKYAMFFCENLSAVTGIPLNIHSIVLPLGISFFTFQQIAYLVDVYKGRITDTRLLHYFVFITFFPQLIAGPIVQHHEIVPQLEKKKNEAHFFSTNLLVGLTIFSMGLFKKVVLADSVAAFSTPVFKAAAQGLVPATVEAWGGALAYTFQLYFDFSGYSDMAIGLGRMFGLFLPINFYSPYKSKSIIEFWRRWHITLSRFLRDYLYIPLGGNRKGPFRRYIHVIVTMLLGGLWHGAGWTFVIWGGLHGLYLAINHAWRSLRRRLGNDRQDHSGLLSGLSQVITFLVVVVAWVFFRAENITSAMRIIKSMFLIECPILPQALSGRIGVLEAWLSAHGVLMTGTSIIPLSRWAIGMPLIILLLCISWFLPNLYEIMADYHRLDSPPQPNTSRWSLPIQWHPTRLAALITAFAAFVALMSLNTVNEFLYFQF
ncbi:MAG: MBOAT family protein [Desulfobacteraceae bacterium]|nr:MBOAT family protein [Desulfobacteraceae bacterium]